MARGVWSGSMVVCYIVFLYLFSVGYRADPDFDLDLSHYGTHFVISSALNDYNTTLGEDDVIWILQILNPTTKTARLKIEVAGTVSKMAHVGALRAQNVHVSPLMRSEQVGLTQSLVVWSTDAVSVTVINNGRSHEGLLAFPVSVFGTQYIVVTLPGNPVLQVLTSHDLTHVTIHFTDMSRDLEASDQHKFKVVYNGETYTPGSTLEVTIESKYQVFQFHDCHAHHRLRSDFTGTLITSSLPVGVISGNCVTNSNPDDDHGSHLEEMLVPISSWGYHFYIATPSAGYPTQTRIRVVSLTFGVLRLHTDPGGLEDTQQVDGRTVAEELTLLYRAPTFWCQKILSGEVHAYLVSTVPIFVVMYWPDKVTGSKGHSGMIQLVPNENWLSWYYIRAPDLQNKNSFIYLSIVAMTTDVDGIRIGFNHLDSTDENTVIKEMLSGFTFIARLVSSGQGHVIQHLHQHTFACYTRLVVKAGRVLYQQGMAFRNITQFRLGCALSRRYMEPQDGLDNDCDGLVDEENHNNRSDDFDDLVDEDLGVVDGHWSPWSVGLVCSVQCAGTGELVYLRSCTNPEKSRDGRDCQGPATRSGDGVDGVCYSRHIKCPSACENGTWGYDCVYPCPPGCQDVCDKVTGRCRTCKHGYDLSPDRMCGQGQDADMNLQPLGDNQNSKEESLISDSESPGWMIYTTVVIIAILIFVGIAYEIYKRLRNSLQGRSVGSMFNKKGDDDDDSDDEDASVAPSRSTSKQKT